jgi:hypothetical protein
MRSRLGLLAVAAMVAGCMLALPAVAQADTEDIYRADVAISNNFTPPVWLGTVSGDINGTVKFQPLPANSYVVGSVKHFYEIFTITTSAGVISGYDVGVWNFSTFKFRAEGWVTSATGDWAGLTGYKYHEMGYTTPLNPPTPIHGTGSMFIAAP